LPAGTLPTFNFLRSPLRRRPADRRSAPSARRSSAVDSGAAGDARRRRGVAGKERVRHRLVTRRWRIGALAVLLLFMAGGMLSIVEMSGDPAFIVVGAIPIVVLIVAIVSMWMRRGESEET
jgi:hypothetical protein